MKPLTIFVCEDEDISLGVNKVVLEKILKKRNITADITYCQNDKEQEDTFLANIELAILDIDLEGSTRNGIQLAEKIRELNPYTVFIFITSHSEFAHEASKIHLSGFLDKPLNPYDFEDALYRGIMQINGYRVKRSNNHIVTFQNGKVTMKEKSVISVEKLPNTHEVEIRTKESKFQVYDTIKDTEKRLSSNFLKLNGSVIVNLAYVVCMEGNTVVMYGGVRYNVPIRNRDRVRKAYEEFATRKMV